jgi:hypothetical protein
VQLSPLGYIVAAGVTKRGGAVLWLLTVNGKLLVERHLSRPLAASSASALLAGGSASASASASASGLLAAADQLDGGMAASCAAPVPFAASLRALSALTARRGMHFEHELDADDALHLVDAQTQAQAQAHAQAGRGGDSDEDAVAANPMPSQQPPPHVLLHVTRGGEFVLTARRLRVCVRDPHSLAPLQWIDCSGSASASSTLAGAGTVGSDGTSSASASSASGSASAAFITALDVSHDERVLAVARSDGAVMLFTLPQWAPHAPGALQRAHARLRQLLRPPVESATATTTVVGAASLAASSASSSSSSAGKDGGESASEPPRAESPSLFERFKKFKFFD